MGKATKYKWYRNFFITNILSHRNFVKHTFCESYVDIRLTKIGFIFSFNSKGALQQHLRYISKESILKKGEENFYD